MSKIMFVNPNGSSTSPFDTIAKGAVNFTTLYSYWTSAQSNDDIIEVIQGTIDDTGYLGNFDFSSVTGITIRSYVTNTQKPYIKFSEEGTDAIMLGADSKIQKLHLEKIGTNSNYSIIQVNGSNCEISDCILHFSYFSTHASVIDSSYASHVINNEIYNGNIGVKAYYDHYIINNTIYNVNTGIRIQVGIAYCVNNIMKGTSEASVTSAYIDFYGSFVRDYNNVIGFTSANGPFGTHDLSVDPLFTNEAGNDVTLQKGSPCIDAGADLSIYPTYPIPTDDILGISRPQYNAYDMGAYEKPLITTSASNLKSNYITVCGSSQPIRFGTSRQIDLLTFLPEYLKQTETNEFLTFFQDFLNTLFSGVDGMTISTSATTSADYLTYNTPANISTKTISILEKINRLTETHDPDLIDLEYLQYFANNLGYNVNINYGELGTSITTESGVCSANDVEKYLRFVVRELPNWYKIKTTRNAVKIMLYSFGLIGDISQYYTNSYSTSGTWKSPDYSMTSDSLANIPNDYFPTPHFIVWIDGNVSTTNLSFNYLRRNEIINAIESIRPINTVFRNLGFYFKDIINLYIGLNTRFMRLIKIENDGYADYWA